jgi:hypothetical protein
LLPRRHILDIWETAGATQDRLLMSTGTLVVDALKYINNDPKRDHLVEALDLNEFICYMNPSIRPNNLALLFHVTSDLLGLLLYGIPKKRRNSIEALEVVDYSSRNVSYPVIEVWRFFRNRIGSKRGKQPNVIDGFISKIRIETDTVERFPFVDDIFRSSRNGLEAWLDPLSRFYERGAADIADLYEKWSSLWLHDGTKEGLVVDMVERLVAQARQDYRVTLDGERLTASILENPDINREENDTFSRLYKEGIELLLSI